MAIKNVGIIGSSFSSGNINLAKNANLQYDDFYDWTHLNKKGSIKAADFIYKNLLNNVFKN